MDETIYTIKWFVTNTDTDDHESGICPDAYRSMDRAAKQVLNLLQADWEDIYDDFQGFEDYLKDHGINKAQILDQRGATAKFGNILFSYEIWPLLLSE